MKKSVNNFQVSGIVSKDAEIREFTNHSVARFPLGVSRQDKSSEDTPWVSALIGIEVWRKNDNTQSFDLLTKGNLITAEGYFSPQEWTDNDGVKHHKLVMVANKIYETPDREETPEPVPDKGKKKGKKYEFTGTGAISEELKRQCQAEFMPAAGIAADPVVQYMGRNEMERAIERLRSDMVAAAKKMDFIEAAQLRDQLLKMEERLKQLT